MRSLSAQQILQVWEIGQRQHPLDRAMTLLSLAFPDRSLEELSRLSIGQRDACLLTLRELTFGPQLESLAVCPHCGEPLEFTLNVGDIRVNELPPSEAEFDLMLEGFHLRFGTPNSQDLAAIAHAPDLETAQTQLAQRCLRQATQDGQPVDIATLPAPVLTQLANQLATYDPQAEIWLTLCCPVCDRTWQQLFDIVSFFWAELSTQAQRLLGEVHTLARAYGWREADILSMSSWRRRIYLEKVGS